MSFVFLSNTTIYLDIAKVFDTTWHSGLLYKLLELKFSTSVIKFISSFKSQRKLRVSVEGEMSMPRDIQAGVPQYFVLSPTLYSIYVNDTPQTPGVCLGFFADDTCIYATDGKEGVMFSESCSEVSVLFRQNFIFVFHDSSGGFRYRSFNLLWFHLPSNIWRRVKML
jgi:hypothetical protein